MIFIAQLIGLSLLVYFGSICIQKPMEIVKVIAIWPQLIFGKHLGLLDPKSDLREALFLIKSDPDQYEKRFKFQVNMVRLSGYVAIFISVGGACVLTLSK